MNWRDFLNQSVQYVPKLHILKNEKKITPKVVEFDWFKKRQLSDSVRRHILPYVCIAAIKNKYMKMNNYLEQHQQKPTHTIPKYRVGERAFDSDWNELKVTYKNGWRYLKRGDKHIGLNKLQDAEGYSEPIYFNYVFGGGFMNGDNFYYDMLLKK